MSSVRPTHRNPGRIVKLVPVINKPYMLQQITLKVKVINYCKDTYPAESYKSFTFTFAKSI